MAPEQTKVVPLTCHGHSRPITHLSFSAITDDDQYYLITACKDNNPILRDGMTGDWIGTFLGHKGAVWSARLSSDAKLAVTGSADFSAKIWDTHTGEALFTLQHSHIVRAVAFPPGPSPQFVATGGAEKRLRIWRLPSVLPTSDTPIQSTANLPHEEIGTGVHGGTIKSIIFTPDDPNMLITACEDKKLRWWSLTTRKLVAEHLLDGLIGSCELTPASSLSASSKPILSVASGRSVYLFSGSAQQPSKLLKRFALPHDVSCAGLSPLADNQSLNGSSTAVRSTRDLVTGSSTDTWVHLWSYNADGTVVSASPPAPSDIHELEVGKGHHGPVWSVAYSPDGRLYATGSEDGTVKLWKVGGGIGAGPYGLWR